MIVRVVVVLFAICIGLLVAEQFDCPEKGQTISYLRTTYSPWNKHRTWDFKCRGVLKEEEDKRERCEEIFPKPQGKIDFTAACKLENSYLKGMTHWFDPITSTYRYRIRCCSNPVKRILEETCIKRRLITPEESTIADLRGDGVITEIEGKWKEIQGGDGGHTLLVKLCHFEDEIKLGIESYLKFPSGWPVKYDNYTYKCPSGKTIRKIESVWGFHNRDRGMTIKCGQVSDKDLECDGGKFRYPEGTFTDFLEPRSWMIEGCKGQEVMTEIHTAVINGTRRYYFGCCKLKREVVNEQSCQYTRVTGTGTADWFYLVPDDHVIRGISAQWSAIQNDRTNIYLEICGLAGHKQLGLPQYFTHCPPGQVVYGMQSWFDQNDFDRHRNFELHCRYMPYKPLVNDLGIDCRTVTPTKYDGRYDHIVSCPTNLNIAGIEWSEGTGYRFRCCGRPNVNTIESTCYMFIMTPHGFFNKNFSHQGEVINQIIFDDDRFESPGRWIVTVCKAETELRVAKQAYVEFPVGHRTKFGLAERGKFSDFSYGKNCPPGEVIIKVDSVWGVRNKDRGTITTCGLVGPDVPPWLGLMPIYEKRYDYPEGEFGNTTDPEDWESAGCQGQEVLSEISSWYEPGEEPRRYKFGCGVLKEPLIAENTCYWLRAAHEYKTDWTFKSGEGELFRGVRAIYDNDSGDRSFAFELCRLKNSVLNSAEIKEGSATETKIEQPFFN